MAKRRRYTDEFKQNAMALVAEGHTVEEVATQLGLAPGTLWNWVHQRERVAVPLVEGHVDMATHQAALRRIAELERETAFLGKASAYFARKAQP
jgi:transposase